jgi:hypothetical protein
MSEKEKMLQGQWHDANFDPALLEERRKAELLCYDFNMARPGSAEQQSALKELLGCEPAEGLTVLAPVYFDYGKQWDFFEDDEIERPNHRFVKAMTLTRTADSGELPLTLAKGEWCVIELPAIAVGFIRMSVRAEEQSDLIVAFTENPKGTFELGK